VYYDSFNSEWQTTNRLKYAPPTVVTSAQGGYFEPHYGSDEDVIIHFPTSGARTANQNIYGGRNLRIIGVDLGSKPMSFYAGSFLKHADCLQCMNDGIQNVVHFYKDTLDGSYQCFIGGHAMDDTEARGLEMTRVNIRVNEV